MEAELQSFSQAEATKNINKLINQATKDDVYISRKDKPVAVMISTRRYRELEKFEDMLFGKAAELAIKE